MTEPTRCIDCQAPIRPCRMRCGDCNGVYVAQFTGRKPHEPSEEEIYQVLVHQTATRRSIAAGMDTTRDWWE